MSKTDWIQQEIEALQAQGLYNRIRTIESPQGAWLKVDGKRVLNFCSNNYLGLANHPDIVAAAKKSLDALGIGPAAVRSIAGTMTLHVELEKRLAQFKGVEAAITFQSGFTANLATIPALVGKEDVIFSDRLNHASIIDGCRLSGAKIIAYEHNDVKSLEEQIQANLNQYRRALIVTDGVFSMDGDIARLDEIVALAEKHDALVFVDDSHASGFIGKRGKGTHEHCGVLGRVDIITTTLGKALGGASGGCVSGRRELVEMCRQRARPYLFSNAMPPVIVAAAIAVLDLISKSTERRDKLEANARYWRQGLTESGFDLRPGDSPIVPVMLYNARLAQTMARDLFAEGVYVVGFFFPVVPKEQARIRTQLSAGHERKHLDLGLAAFKKIGAKLGILGLKRAEILAKFGA